VVLPAIVPRSVVREAGAVIAGASLPERARIAEAVGLSLLPVAVTPGLVRDPLVRAGAGLVAAQLAVGRADPRVVERPRELGDVDDSRVLLGGQDRDQVAVLQRARLLRLAPGLRAETRPVAVRAVVGRRDECLRVRRIARARVAAAAAPSAGAAAAGGAGDVAAEAAASGVAGRVAAEAAAATGHTRAPPA